MVWGLWSRGAIFSKAEAMAQLIRSHEPPDLMFLHLESWMQYAAVRTSRCSSRSSSRRCSGNGRGTGTGPDTDTDWYWQWW